VTPLLADTSSYSRSWITSAQHTAEWLRPVYSIEPVAAALILILLAPLLAAIAIVIVALSRRNPLVRHNRVGRGGAPLRMLKFRTMWDADGANSGLFVIEDVYGAAPAVKFNGDARVKSRFAAFCRRHSIDELPQLYHVARGEMSLVGPRPITIAELNEYYGPAAREVVSLRPGLTGLWQVTGRNGLSYASRKRLDLFFVRRATAGLYFRILLRSITGVLSGRGAY
jgi:exopolysaccharide production protein ExoY